MASKSPEFLEKNRAEALTDGIFAFALTVLVLNLEVPDNLPNPLPPDPVLNLLVSLSPDFVHYFMAFLVLAGFWVSHHLFFNRLRYVDRNMTWLNLFSLLFIALIPFTANLADTYVDYPLSAIVFELNVLIIGLIYYIEWMYARQDSKLMGDYDPNVIKQGGNRLLIMPGVSILALAIAFSGITWSAILYALVPLLYLLSSFWQK